MSSLIELGQEESLNSLGALLGAFLGVFLAPAAPKHQYFNAAQSDNSRNMAPTGP